MRERVVQASDDLKQRQVDVADAPPDQTPRLAGALQHVFEVQQVLGRALRQKVFTAAFGFDFFANFVSVTSVVISIPVAMLASIDADFIFMCCSPVFH